LVNRVRKKKALKTDPHPAAQPFPPQFLLAGNLILAWVVGQVCADPSTVKAV